VEFPLVIRQPAQGCISVRTVASLSPRFGVESGGLCANYNLNSFGAREVSALTGSTTVGFQMLNTLKRKTNSQGGLLLEDALNRGIGLGAHFIEVYAVDCNEPRQAQVLTQAANKLKQVVQQANASSETR
jgi:hypothetical protein